MEQRCNRSITLAALTLDPPPPPPPGKPNDEGVGWAGVHLANHPGSQTAPRAEESRRGGRSSRGRGRGKGYRKLWEQVTRVGVGGGLQHPNLAASGVRVEDVVERILALRAGEPVGPAASQALLSLDSRAVAALLKEVAKAGHVERAMELFDWLRGCAPGSELRGLCDVYTYTTDISLCSQQKDLRRALELVAELRGRGIQSNVHTFSALMNVCAKCGELELALDVFRQMKAEGCRPNVVTFNTLIDVYGKLGQWRKAVEVLDLVALEGLQPEIRTYNTTLIACNMCNQPLEALKVYESLVDAGRTPTATTCTAMISAYAKGGMCDKALEMYERMIVENLERGLITFVALMSACEKAGRWEMGLKLLGDMEKEGCEPNTAVHNSVIIMLCQAGKWEQGNEIYDEMKTKSKAQYKPDMNILMVLLHAYDRAGQWLQVSKLFDSTHCSGNRVDPTFYHSAIDLLWCTGLYHAQIKAVELFDSVSSNGRLRLGVQMSYCSNVYEILLQSWSVGSATIAIHKWLLETRERFDKDCDYLNGATILVAMGRGRNNKNSSARIVMNAVVAMLSGAMSPFSKLEDAQDSLKLHCSGRALRCWLHDQDSLSHMSCIFSPQIQSHISGSTQDLSISSKSLEAYGVVKKFEDTHQLNYEAMGDAYLAIRGQIVVLGLEIGKRMQLQEEVVHDAVLLMDRVMSTGARLHDGVTVAAMGSLLRISALASCQPGEYCPTQDEIDALVDFPQGSCKELEIQINAALGQDTSALSALRVAMLYVEWLGYEYAPEQFAGSIAQIRSMLQGQLSSSAYINFRPSATAAAAIYCDRLSRGWAPFWPTALARITGYQDLSTPEMSGAINATLEMCGFGFSSSKNIRSIGL